MDQDERLLVERAKSDAEAFGILYDRYAEDIYRFAQARLGNVAAAEDVTAEVFVKALRGIGRYRDQWEKRLDRLETYIAKKKNTTEGRS